MKSWNVLVLVIVFAAIGCFARSDSSNEGRMPLAAESPAAVVTPLGAGTSGETVRKSITPPSDVDGNVVDPNVQFMDGIQVGFPGYQLNGSNYAFDGTNYAIAFADRGGVYGENTSVLFMRISETGTAVAPAATISVPPKMRERSLFTSANVANISQVKVAASPAGTIVGWVQGTYNEEQSLFAVRIAPDGTVLDTTPIRIASPSIQYRSRVSGTQTAVYDPFLVSADSGGFRFAVVEPHAGGGLDINSYRVALSSTSAPVGQAVTIAASLDDIFGVGQAQLVATELGGIFAWSHQVGIAPS